MEKISGVYKITNILTGDFYIGSSKSINDRWRCHRSPANWALSQRFKKQGILHPTIEAKNYLIKGEIKDD